MSAKSMAEVLAEHGFRKWGDWLDDFNWVVCLCGATIGGSEKWQTLLAQHQTAALTAAGFGLVADAKAEAWDEGALAVMGAHGIGHVSLSNPYLRVEP